MPSIYTWRQVRAYIAWAVVVGFAVGLAAAALAHKLENERQRQLDAPIIESDGRTP